MRGLPIAKEYYSRGDARQHTRGGRHWVTTQGNAWKTDSWDRSVNRRSVPILSTLPLSLPNPTSRLDGLLGLFGLQSSTSYTSRLLLA